MGLAALFADNHPYSQLPPGDLDYSQCPMFVCFGHEDYCVNAGGQTKEQVIQAWKGFYDDGHEIANHTWNHPHGSALSKEEWKQQITTANDFLVANIGVSANEIQGFRTPYLEYSTNTMNAIKELGFMYDCSIEFGYNGWVPIEPDSGYWNGMTDPKTHMKLFWPHTLDNGSPPGHSAVGNPTVAGLWEVPVYTCLKQDNSGVVTGFDFNLWKVMDKNEFLETLKHNFDLRRQGNRNPLTINTHTDYYTQYNADANTEFTKATWEQRQDAIEEFLDYVLQFPETRVVSFSDMLTWMKNPVAIGPTAVTDKEPADNQLAITAKMVSTNTITFSLPSTGFYTFSLVNLKGRTVRQISQRFCAGERHVSFSSPLPGGIYLVRINRGEQLYSKKAIIIK